MRTASGAARSATTPPVTASAPVTGRSGSSVRTVPPSNTKFTGGIFAEPTRARPFYEPEDTGRL
jgi:hypothetical protein